MTDVTGSDVPKGLETKWYAGGTAKSETVTVTAAMVSAGGFALAEAAEYGSVVATVDGTFTAIIEYKTNKDTPATESGGTDFVGYVGITEADIVELRYIGTATTAITQVMSCQDVSTSSSGGTLSAAVQGQANKITSAGTTSNTADLGEIFYNQTLVALCLGDAITGSPTSGKKKWTNAFHGMRKIGALVGKRLDASGAVLYKWFLVGATANNVGADFPTEDFYTRSMSFDVDYLTEADLR
jgi:hypothetical protein